MKIGLVGYFGWGNYGDELFLKVYEKYFPDDDFVFFHDPNINKLKSDLSKIVQIVDVIFIGGGDLIIPWYKSWLYWDKRFLEKPVYIFGVGVPTWGEEKKSVMDHYKQFFNHKNIKWVCCRSNESVTWVKEKLSPTCDVSYFPDIVLSLEFKKNLSNEKRLAIITRKQTKYESKYLSKVARIADDNDLTIRHVVLATGKTSLNDISAVHSFNFPNQDIVYRDSIDALTEELMSADYIVSMKFHGCIVAYKGRIPSISLSRADKFTSFYHDIGNEEFISEQNDSQLPEKFLKLINGGFTFDKYEEQESLALQGVSELRNRIDAENGILRKCKRAIQNISSFGLVSSGHKKTI